jgi:hypothetical protein
MSCEPVEAAAVALGDASRAGDASWRWLRTCDRTAFVAFGLWLALVVGLALSGCAPGLCGRSSDCASGYVCTTVGLCAVPPVDASTAESQAVAADASVARPPDAFVLPIDAPDLEPLDACDAVAADADQDAPEDDGLTGGGVR